MFVNNRWLILAIVTSTLFLIIIDMTVLYTALPRLTQALGATASEKLWIVNAYPLVVGEEHANIAAQVRQLIEHYQELKDVIALLGVEELGAEERLAVGRARRLQRFLTQPFFVAEAFTDHRAYPFPAAPDLPGRSGSCSAGLACDQPGAAYH